MNVPLTTGIDEDNCSGRLTWYATGVDGSHFNIIWSVVLQSRDGVSEHVPTDILRHDPHALPFNSHCVCGDGDPSSLLWSLPLHHY